MRLIEKVSWTLHLQHNSHNLARTLMDDLHSESPHRSDVGGKALSFCALASAWVSVAMVRRNGASAQTCKIAVDSFGLFKIEFLHLHL